MIVGISYGARRLQGAQRHVLDYLIILISFYSLLLIITQHLAGEDVVLSRLSVSLIN